MEFMSIKEAAERWGIDPSNLGKLCRKGKIEGAEIVGRNWLIPREARRPADGRTRAAREEQKEAVFRFPLYMDFPGESFIPPLSEEEAKLRQAQIDLFSCEFQKARDVFEELSGNAENIYVKICAQFFMCVLAVSYDLKINWDQYYFGLQLLLSKDFPYRKEMELLLPWLDLIIGQVGRIPEKLNIDSAYEYHSSAWYMNAFVSIFNSDIRNLNSINVKCTEPFGTLARISERDGHYLEAQELHLTLFAYHYCSHNEEAMQYHLRRALRIAYEHDLLYVVADAEAYYPDAFNPILREYPDSFAERVRKSSRIIYGNFSRFAGKSQKTTVFEKLSRSDYRYVFYALEGFTNRQVAGFSGVSERTVAKKYNDIYNKLDISGKQELVAEVNSAFGKKK